MASCDLMFWRKNMALKWVELGEEGGRRRHWCKNLLDISDGLKSDEMS